MKWKKGETVVFYVGRFWRPKRGRREANTRRGTEKPTGCRRFLKIEGVNQEVPWLEKEQSDAAVSRDLPDGHPLKRGGRTPTFLGT